LRFNVIVVHSLISLAQSGEQTGSSFYIVGVACSSGSASQESFDESEDDPGSKERKRNGGEFVSLGNQSNKDDGSRRSVRRGCNHVSDVLLVLFKLDVGSSLSKGRHEGTIVEGESCNVGRDLHLYGCVLVRILGKGEYKSVSSSGGSDLSDSLKSGDEFVGSLVSRVGRGTVRLGKSSYSHFKVVFDIVHFFGRSGSVLVGFFLVSVLLSFSMSTLESVVLVSGMFVFHEKVNGRSRLEGDGEGSNSIKVISSQVRLWRQFVGVQSDVVPKYIVFGLDLDVVGVHFVNGDKVGRGMRNGDFSSFKDGSAASHGSHLKGRERNGSGISEVEETKDKDGSEEGDESQFGEDSDASSSSLVSFGSNGMFMRNVQHLGLLGQRNV
jgi:hypothetical protein